MSGRIIYLITMGVIFSFMPVFVCLFAGCTQQEGDNGVAIYSFSKDECVIIGGCEYAKCYTHGQNYVYTHKGSCKKCWDRLQTMINANTLEKNEVVTNTIYQTNNITVYKTNSVYILQGVLSHNLMLLSEGNDSDSSFLEALKNNPTKVVYHALGGR